MQLKRGIRSCYTFDNLYALSRGFNEHGMVIKPTASNKMIVCRVQDGEPISETIVSDFIFVGSLNQKDEVIPSRIIQCVLEFVERCHGEEYVPEEISKQQHQQLALYGVPMDVGRPTELANEDISELTQELEAPEPEDPTITKMVRDIY